jgi:hypothetical protein
VYQHSEGCLFMYRWLHHRRYSGFLPDDSDYAEEIDICTDSFELTDWPRFDTIMATKRAAKEVPPAKRKKCDVSDDEQEDNSSDEDTDWETLTRGDECDDVNYGDALCEEIDLLKKQKPLSGTTIRVVATLNIMEACG